jgi:hypothetical protein
MYYVLLTKTVVPQGQQPVFRTTTTIMLDTINYTVTILALKELSFWPLGCKCIPCFSPLAMLTIPLNLT